MTFEPKVGFWRTRCGIIAEVEFVSKYRDSLLTTHFPLVGGLVDNGDRDSWTASGEWDDGRNLAPLDLVEYLGTELPKRKKKIKVAPVVVRYGDTENVWIRARLFASEADAREEYGDSLVRWLIDTPYALEVEVDDE